jgi:hypothetical protein
MDHGEKTELDTAHPIGDHFALVVAAISPVVLWKCAGRMGRGTRPAGATRWEEEARDREC